MPVPPARAFPPPCETALPDSNLIPYLVTTSKRGVFFGYHAPLPADTLPDTLTLKDCRMVIYYSVECRGITGLATGGPKAGSRIAPQAVETTMSSVDSASVCTPEAVAAFERGVWS